MKHDSQSRDDGMPCHPQPHLLDHEGACLPLLSNLAEAIHDGVGLILGEDARLGQSLGVGLAALKQAESWPLLATAPARASHPSQQACDGMRRWNVRPQVRQLAHAGSVR